jgi:hypothetical protein
MLTIKNERCIEFYKQNPHIDFESVNLIFLDILEKLMNNMSQTLDDSYTRESLKTLLETNKQLTNKLEIITESQKNTSTNLTHVQNTVSELNTQITNNIYGKISDLRDKYIQDMREALSETNNIKHLNETIEKTNTSLLEKTSLLLKEIIPKNQETYYNQLKLDILSLQNNFKEDKNQELLLEKINSRLSGFQEQIIHKIKEQSDKSLTTMSDVKNYLERQKNSTLKGKQGELKLESILNDLFRSADIANCTGMSMCGDFIMRRKDKPTILFENKEYATNIPNEEIKKFIRDVEHNNCHGIFLSQSSGITNKNHFEIETHHNNILIYVHYVKYEPETILLAVNVLDHLNHKLKSIKTVGETIQTEVLMLINKEYQEFIHQKKILLENIKNNHKELLKQITEMDLPNLTGVLAKRFAQVESAQHKCDKCNIFIGKNAKALAAHRRKCNKPLLDISDE